MNRENLKKTALHSSYSGIPGVKLVDFGGWEMPVQFAGGILSEHQAVRNNTGLFDVSHMGEIAVAGHDAEEFLDYLLTNRVTGAGVGQCIYSPMCYKHGGIVDDLLVYVLAPNEYLLVVNAANTNRDYSWISEKLGETELKVTVTDVSTEWAQLALQGPEAAALLKPLCDPPQAVETGYYRHAGMVKVAGTDVLLSRTGYTGEDGYELYCAADDAAALWKILIDTGAAACGLGARDVLRLEARLPLYGHELSESISPLEAGIGMFVKLDKENFIGQKALIDSKESGIPRQLYGLEMIEAGVAREGYEVFLRGSKAEPSLGIITSGGKSPVRDSFIALALLKRGSVYVGDEVEVEIRGRRKAARVVKTPFYRRKS